MFAAALYNLNICIIKPKVMAFSAKYQIKSKLEVNIKRLEKALQLGCTVSYKTVEDTQQEKIQQVLNDPQNY